MNTIAFGAPQFLWLLAAPGLFLLAWLWRFSRRIADLRRLRDRRSVPIRERYAIGGDLWFWLFLILACASFAVALARPRGVTTVVNRAGLDIVVLQDGSASMHVDGCSGAASGRAGDCGDALAAVDGLPPPARRLAQLERRSHGAHRLRAHRDAADQAHQRSQHRVLLPRSSSRSPSVQARGRHDLGHQSRAGDRVGTAPAREGQGAARARR